jgi:tRNA threonylcarbamoyl adenosine modification protein (Sua5/YciO/YrdC/YwlC family)
MADLIRIYEENPNPKEIKKVVEVLRKGGLVIYPTDTVYGLGCDIANNKALERLAQVKGVKLEKANWSFICHDLSNLSDYTKQIESSTFKILKKALPGPYTFILQGSKSLPSVFRKKKEVGIRVPNNNIILDMVKLLGNPIVSTSIRDEDSILEYTTDPELIHEKWDKLVDIVIDGGYGDNQASTIIDFSNGTPEVLREGKGPLDIL